MSVNKWTDWDSWDGAAPIGEATRQSWGEEAVEHLKNAKVGEDVWIQSGDSMVLAIKRDSNCIEIIDAKVRRIRFYHPKGE